jgi:transglutaminase-like putative cysteine protease
MSRSARLVAISPVLAALALQSVAHQRWWLAGPVALVMLFLGLRAKPWGAPGGVIIFGALAAAVGLGLGFVSPLPDSPLTTLVLSAVTTALMALAVAHVGARRWAAAWASSWALAVVSVHRAMPPSAFAALGLLALCTVVALAAQARAWRQGVTGVTFTVLLFVLASGAAVGLSLLLRAGEGLLMSTVLKFITPETEPELELGVRRTEHQQLDPTPLYELDAPVEKLRTVVFDAFDGLRWTESPERSGPAGPLPGGGGHHARLWVLQAPSVRLPVPEGLTAVEGHEVVLRPGRLVQVEDALGRQLELSWSDSAPTNDPPTEVTLALPEALRDELAPLAAGLLGPPGDARTDAEALARHFANSHEYSLDVDLRGHGHPLAVLVRERRAAYCTYFASALAALLRTRGVHARVVGGFAPESANPLTGRQVVLARDAHAWVEAWVPAEGRWATFDPTPWRSRDAALGLEPRGWLGQVLEGVSSVVRRTASLVRHHPLDALALALGSPVTWGLALIAAFFAVRRSLAQRTPAARAVTYTPADAALAAAVARYDALLARCGVTRAADETEADTLRRLPDALIEAAGAFVRTYQAERFRGRTGRSLDDALAGLERAVAAHRPPAPAGSE